MKTEAIDTETPHDTSETHKKGRHRKKQLYTSILQQMEFYFSDSNLNKDRFLSQLLQENPEIDLSIFLKFNKIRKLTTNLEDIRKAVKKSELIQLSEDNNRISRRAPIQDKANVEECTIYVEKLQSDVTHEWLNSVFSEFGNVVYVSLPKYKNNGAVKGFAFVEFDKEEEARKALEYFEGIGGKIPSNAEPEQLRSISAFEESNTETQTIEKPDASKAVKRKFDELGDAVNAVEKSKKPKTEEPDAEEKSKKRKVTEAGDASETEDAESKKKKKLKKEHKKKNYIKELGLQVLSKREWRKMRNKYLELQRKKMKEFKKHLLKAKYSQANYEEKFKKPENGETKPVEETPKLEFVEGVIVKIKLTEPCPDGKKFKNDLRASCSDIKYVDIPNPGSEFVYVRFSSKDTAKNFCTKESTFNTSVLSGENEKSYWERLYQTRETKFQKTNKVRGRDKLLKKANKIMASHVKFDE